MTSAAFGRRKLGVLALVTLALVLIAGAASLTPSPAGGDDVIVIGSSELRPPAFQTMSERRVTFLNRTGKVVHLELEGEAVEHHLIQVPDRIWAIFHRSGDHPYVVHFPDGAAADLHGVVEIVADPHERPEPQACVGVTVMGACLER